MVNQISVNEYDILNKAAAEYLKKGAVNLKCPRCGKKLVYESQGSIEIIRCEDETCIKSIRRGI